MEKSEIRKAYLQNKYVIISPKRAKRPYRQKEQTAIKAATSCFFCPENLDKNNIIDRIDINNHWQVVSIANIFPAVSLDNPLAYGVQEVIIETPKHTPDLAEINVKNVKKVIEMYARRTKELSLNPKLDYILCFKNQGPKSGASIPHAHSQVFASKLLPPDISQELDLAERYHCKNQSCPYCDLIKKEVLSERLIWEDKNVIAIAPYASEYHYEAWIFTKRHLDNIAKLSPQEISSFAQAYHLILAKLYELDLSFNAFMHQVVSDRNQHFYFKIQPRDSIWAGVELGSGLIINTVPPEEAAKFYRI